MPTSSDSPPSVPKRDRGHVLGPVPPHRIFLDWLTGDLHAALLASVLEREADFEPTTIIKGSGEVVDETGRKSRRLPGFGPMKAAFLERVMAFAPDMFAGAGMKPFEIGRVEIEIAAHNDGAHFHRHTDIPIGASRENLAGSSSYDRIVSGVYYFHAEPKGFTGGDLRLHRFGGTGADGEYVDIAPRQNSLLVFPSWASHEVRRVDCPSGRFRDSRFAVNCWLHRKG